MPPKRAKGHKHDKNMTPEERAQIAKFKLIAKKRAAEQKKQKIKYDYLGREIQYGALTIKRHEKKWREMLLKIAMPRMRIELEYAWHNFERIVDVKDFTISLMMDDIKDAEEQYQRNIRSHIENVDNLIVLFKEQLYSLKEENRRDLRDIDISSQADTYDISKNHHDAEDYMKTMLFGLEMYRRKLEIEGRGEMIGKLENEVAKNVDSLLKMKEEFINKFNGVWESAKTFLSEYNSKTAERKKGYLHLRNQDETVQALLEEQINKIYTFYKTLKKLKDKHNRAQLTQGTRISDMLHERQFYADTFWELRAKLETERSLDNKNLMFLVTCSNDATDHLKRVEKKGERILELAAICRKLETQEEKVRSFPTPLDFEDEILPQVHPLQQKHDFTDLKLFWRKVAKADVSRHCINEEVEVLKRENKRLLQKIHEYCECMDCEAYQWNQALPDSINKIDLNLEVAKYDKFNGNTKHPSEMIEEEK